MFRIEFWQTAVSRIVVALALIWTVSPALAQDTQSEPVKPVVTVAPVQLEVVADFETFSGRVEAVSRIDLLARVSGFTQSVGFKEGQNVSRGDVLFEIEPGAYQAAVTQIEGQIKSAEAQKILADIELARQQTLLEKQDVAESVVQQAQAQQGQIEGQLENLQGSLKIAQLNLSYATISAPFDGRVGLTDIAIGAYVSSQSGALATLSSIDPIHVTFPVAEATLLDYRALRAKNPDGPLLEVELTLANGSVLAEKGKIAVVDTEVQAGTDTVIVRAVFANADGALLDGQLVRVRVIDQSQEKSLTIPVLALQKDQSGYFVLVVGSDGKVEKRGLTLARISGTTVVIDTGLKAGEQVITQGAQRAQPGKMVDPQDSSGDPAKAGE